MRELQQSIGSRELTRWMAFDQISPIGDDRAEYLNGILCSLLFNINRGKATAKKPSDFMPYIDREAIQRARDKQLSADLLAAFKGMK